jgi:hypothetical protein
MEKSNKALLACQDLIDEVNQKQKDKEELTHLLDCQTTARIENA